MQRNKLQLKTARHKRVRAKVVGTKEKPRLSVFRSNRHIFAQLIDDTAGKTLVSTSDFQPKADQHKAEKIKKTKTDTAKRVGTELAKSAVEKKITKVVFDRGGYKYHGRIKAVAEGAREGGLKF